MGEIQEYLEKIEKLSAAHKDYKTEAYHFVLAALSHTVSKFDQPQHVSGQQLSWGIRNYAFDQFGPLAKTVLEYWGLHETLDFGKIVYRMIELKLMSKTETDSIEDFRNVFCFDEEFGKNYDFLAHEGEGDGSA